MGHLAVGGPLFEEGLAGGVRNWRGLMKRHVENPLHLLFAILGHEVMATDLGEHSSRFSMRFAKCKYWPSCSQVVVKLVRNLIRVVLG